MGLAAKSAVHMTIVVDATHLKAYRATSRPIGKKNALARLDPGSHSRWMIFGGNVRSHAPEIFLKC